MDTYPLLLPNGDGDIYRLNYLLLRLLLLLLLLRLRRRWRGAEAADVRNGGKEEELVGRTVALMRRLRWFLRWKKEMKIEEEEVKEKKKCREKSSNKKKMR